MCQRLIQAGFPTAANAVTLQECLAMSASYFFAQKMLMTGTVYPINLIVERNSPRTSSESVEDKHPTLLRKITPQFTNSQFYFNYYHNLYIFCDHLYKELMSSAEPLSEIIPPDQTLEKIDVLFYSSSFQNLVTRASNAAVLKQVILCIPPDNHLYYHEINQMLFTLLQHKVLVILADCTDKDIISLANIISELSELKKLGECLNTFLDELWVHEKLKLQFLRRNANQNTEELEPRLRVIISIENARDEVISIFNSRKLPVDQIMPPLTPPAPLTVLRPFVSDELPATFGDLSSIDELSPVGELPTAAKKSTSKAFEPDVLKPSKDVEPDALKPPNDAAPKNLTNAVVAGELNPSNTITSAESNFASAVVTGKLNQSNSAASHELNPFNSEHSIPIQLPGVNTQTPSSTTQLLPPPLLPQVALPLSAPPLHIRGLSLLAPSSASTSVPPPSIPDANTITHTDRETTHVQLLLPNIDLHSTAQSKNIHSTFSPANSLATIERNISPSDIVDEQLPITEPDKPESSAAESGSFIRSALRFMTFASDTADLLRPPAPETENDLNLPSVPSDTPQAETAAQNENSAENSADSQKRKTVSRPLAG